MKIARIYKKVNNYNLKFNWNVYSEKSRMIPLTGVIYQSRKKKWNNSGSHMVHITNDGLH